MSEPDEYAAERTLNRHQLHTLRERVHCVERRMHDMEMAQELGAVRADVHADSIGELRKTIAELLVDVEALGEHK